MKRHFLFWLIGSLSILTFVSTTEVMAASASNLNQQQALLLGTDAYIYGYPLVMMDMTKRVMTNVAAPSLNVKGAPMGQFYNARVYPDPAFKDVTAPNADTLYSIAWVDLTNEPYILHLPDENDRYYLMPLLDAWTNVFADPGKRTTGTDPQDYVIVGPNWNKSLPEGMPVLHSPTNLIWIIGRTYCSGTPEDYKVVHQLQDQYALIPLSAYGKTYTPPSGKVNPNIDMKTAVRDQVNQMDAATFFARLAELMKDNPPAVEDAPMVEKLARLGLVPGKSFDLSKTDSEEAIGLTAAVSAAQEKIMTHYGKAGVEKNHWSITTETGQYGTDYLQRALLAAIGLGANLPQDAIYPITKLDQNGEPLNGANRYIMHFKKGQLPPVKGFWSLTMYDNEYFFIKNPINRYSINPRDHFTFNADGSLDIYIQAASPGKDKESNWLPAPQSAFILMLRLYWPKAEILNGTWVPPGVEKIKETVVKTTANIKLEDGTKQYQ